METHGGRLAIVITPLASGQMIPVGKHPLVINHIVVVIPPDIGIQIMSFAQFWTVLGDVSPVSNSRLESYSPILPVQPSLFTSRQVNVIRGLLDLPPWTLRLPRMRRS